MHDGVDQLFRKEGPIVLATLVRLMGDLDLAEDAAQEAFSAALRQWPTAGIPENPRSWLISTGRFKAIDALRKRDRSSSALREDWPTEESWNDETIADDTLRLIFLCCHPELAEEAQIALTLREVCALTTEEIAKAFLSTPQTVAQRIVRAKAKLRDRQVDFELPADEDLGARLSGVLRVIYLVFNEGYYASSGVDLVRTSLTSEAIRLGRLLTDLLPEREVFGLLSIMILAESRQAARMDAVGDIVLLPDQERSLWNQALVEEGAALARRAGEHGPYAIQAAIAAVHAQSRSSDETEWSEIVRLYDRLLEFTDSPVVELNRAVAVGMSEGPLAGLRLVDAILERGNLEGYALAHSARADFLRRLGRTAEALGEVRRALSLTAQAPERRLLERWIREMESGPHTC